MKFGFDSMRERCLQGLQFPNLPMKPTARLNALYSKVLLNIYGIWNKTEFGGIFVLPFLLTNSILEFKQILILSD